ncbi:hypothetical protein AAFP30_08335 [Gordonia sp. CPCC 205515]|uniref:hypothetical protein n=1 Tax=Gordonia sp. CPCC 205515 TaxID=3140791 RepID=UPI003AF3FB5C
MADTTAARTGGPSVGSVLGVSVIEDQIASVVRDPDGAIIASNLVDLADPSAQSAQNAIGELVDSVPYEIERIGIACARPATQNYLQANLSPGSSRPVWYAKVSVTDLPAALAETARNELPARGIIAAIDLDRSAVPSPGASLVTLDSATGEVLGTAEFAYGSPGPVTDPSCAREVADALTAAPGGSSVTSVVCTGPGADIPDAASTLEYALARPVTVVDQPALAPAVGAALVAAKNTVAHRNSSNQRRWWLIGAALAGAIALGAIAASAVFAGVEADQDEAAPTTTITQPASTTTVTETAQAVTQTQVETQRETETVTASRDAQPSTATETVTETVTETADPTTVTVTETANGGVGGGVSPAP